MHIKNKRKNRNAPVLDLETKFTQAIKGLKKKGLVELAIKWNINPKGLKVDDLKAGIKIAMKSEGKID